MFPIFVRRCTAAWANERHGGDHASHEVSLFVAPGSGLERPREAGLSSMRRAPASNGEKY